MYPQTLDSPNNDANSVGDSSTSRPRKRPRLIDTEAQDSDEQCSSEDRVRNGNPATRSAFPQFMQLPPNLRHHIWKLYCPDLSGKPRVLEFTPKSPKESEAPTEPSERLTLTTDRTLACQTKSLRAMLSTHHETRSIAVRIFPDELALDVGSGRAIVRFRKETDVIFLLGIRLGVNFIPPNFATQVQNLSIGTVRDNNNNENNYYGEALLQVVPAIKSIFPNLKRLYSLWPIIVFGTKDLGNWCATDYVHKYMLEPDYRETGMGQSMKCLFCWPDLDAHPDFARSEVPKLCSLEEMEEAGLEIWWMVMFQRESCFKAYDLMRWLYLNPHSANAGDDDEQMAGDGTTNAGNDRATGRAFPQFVQLPPELRHHIWKLYCPDLSGKPRILQFTVEEDYAPIEPSERLTLTTNVVMANQTKSLRAMLSTHHESRSIAVRVFPDELALDMGSRRAVVRFRKETDVVFLLDLWLDVNYIPPNFATQVQNLAIGAVQENYEENTYYDETLRPVVPAVKGILPNLKRLYSLWPVVICGTKNLGNWCVTEYVHEYMLENHQPMTNLGECTQSLFCWPDLDAHPDFARSNVPKWCSLEETEETGLEIWSMAKFERVSCFRAYDRMKALYLNPHLANEGDDQDSSSSHDDHGADSDEFEIEGMDNDEIVELDG
ncbi:hypothetical protein E4U12_008412 [Claviceps purpurea]|nr:hypothetical protein E4U12_008412 [Claviceps purpurea]